eukprot:TCONS_00014638-protein
MELSEANSPLLNEYKLDYVKKILPQTFLGGVQLWSSFRLPWYIYVLQFLLWFCPFIFGIIFTVILENISDLDVEIYSIILGIIIFIIYLVLNLILLYTERSKPSTQTIITNNFFAEDDEIIFTKCFSLTTYKFIISSKKSFINVILHPLVAGITSGLSLFFLLPSSLNTTLNHQTGAIVYFIFGWIVTCIAVYPLIGKPPKEPNSFQLNDLFEFGQLTRGCYVVILMLTDLLWTSSTFRIVSKVLYLTFPIFWSFGLLPSIDVFIIWIVEEICTKVLGGTSMANDIRLLLIFIPSCVAVLVCYFITHQTISLILLAVLAMALSTDIPTMVLSTLKRFRVGSIRFQNLELRPRHYPTTCVEISALILHMALTSVIVGLTTYFRKEIHQKDDLVTITGTLLIALFVLTLLIKQFLQLICFGIIKNPVLNLIDPHRNKLHWVLFVLEKFALPIILVLHTSIFVTSKSKESFDLLFVMFSFRAFRTIFQDIHQSTFNIVVYTIIYWYQIEWNFWQNMEFPSQLFIIFLLIIWTCSFIKKIWFVILLIIASKSGKSGKENQSKINKSILVTLTLFPVLLLVMLLSTVLSAPMLPLFTLPLFIIGFPRPKRMWPNADKATKSTSSDWTFYEQLTPALQEALNVEFYSGVFSNAQAGDFYLARFQDRIIWISVLEHGFMYKNIVVKGLELQETSCHTTEAESIDELLDFDSYKIINKYFAHTLTLTTKMNLDAYSDAKNVLTGIIDNPDFHQTLSKTFPNVLLFLSMKMFQDKCKQGVIDDTVNLNSQESNDNILGGIISDQPFSSFDTPTPYKATFDETKFTIPQNNKDLLKKNSENNVENKHADVSKCNTEDESDDEFGDFGFGDSDKSETSSDESSLQDGNMNLQDQHWRSLASNGKHTKFIDPPVSWLLSAPFGESELRTMSGVFNSEHYQFFIGSLTLKDEDLILVKNDITLMQSYRLFLLNCFCLLERGGLANDWGINEGASHIYKMFCGKLPWSPRMNWIENNQELKQMVIQAYRIAFKLTYDAFLIGENSIEIDEEFLDSIHEMEKEWFVGLEDEVEWWNNILKQCPNILSVGRNEDDGVYTSRLLTQQNLQVPIASINSECVNGLWAALALELYYFTNDDEERYSCHITTRKSSEKSSLQHYT